MTTEPDPAHILTDTWLIFSTLTGISFAFTRTTTFLLFTLAGWYLFTTSMCGGNPLAPAVHHVGRGLRTITGHGTWTAPPQGPGT